MYCMLLKTSVIAIVRCPMIAHDDVIAMNEGGAVVLSLSTLLLNTWAVVTLQKQEPLNRFLRSLS